MATKSGEQCTTNIIQERANRKRGSKAKDEHIEKQQKQDGFSWWTCLLLDIPTDQRHEMRIPVFHKEE